MADQTPYTPSLDVAAIAYAGSRARTSGTPLPEGIAEFDRLIAQVRAEAWDEGYEAAARFHENVFYTPQTNPYRADRIEESHD